MLSNLSLILRREISRPKRSHVSLKNASLASLNSFRMICTCAAAGVKRVLIIVKIREVKVQATEITVVNSVNQAGGVGVGGAFGPTGGESRRDLPKSDY
jgi:hypothetical protein